MTLPSSENDHDAIPIVDIQKQMSRQSQDI